MGKYFSDKTEEGIQLVWHQFDFEKIHEGQKLLEQAANEGDADAYCFLARTYLGIGNLPSDLEKAFELLKKSASLGSACGILTMLQFSKLSGEARKLGTEKLKKAAEAVQSKAEGGHAFCQLIMGMYYYWGGYWIVNDIDIDKEYDDEDAAAMAKINGAVPWFEKALYNGLTTALVNLYDIYVGDDDDDDLPGDPVKLEKALRFASDCGDPKWQSYLGNWLYENGKYEECLKHYEKLAANGYARAWYDIGFQYERGIGVGRDGEKAIAAYETGAKAGSMDCQTRLGKQLIWGDIVTKDETQAYFWFSKAAEQGDEIAKMFKGHCLLYGLGVKRDMDEGTTLLINALNYNYPNEGSSQSMVEESQFDWDEDMLQMFWDLGDAYENGLGMPVKPHFAGYYFSMVAAGGWPEGIEKMTHYKEGLFGKWKRIK